MKIEPLSILLLTSLMLACGGGGGGTGGGDNIPTGPADVPWTDGAWTQPVPAWGSSTRLTIPYPLTALSLPDLGAFGAHEGGHPEGLDHVWLYVTTGNQSLSWGAGTVTAVNNYGTQYVVIVDYGDGLLGTNMSILTPNVSVGQAVKAGDLLGQAVPGTLNSEFQLMDEHRGDGILTDTNGYSYVSPFDYLEAGQQAALVALYQSQVVAPVFALGQEVNSGKPWEPYLHNRTLIHHQNRGTLIGEWILGNRPWSTPDPLYFDILTLNAVTNAYGSFAKFNCTDNNLTAATTKGIMSGAYAPGQLPGQVTFTYDGSATPNWYGLYSIDESGPRAVMILEWSPQGFPTVISANAARYYERLNVYVGRDAELLGVLP